ncbi:FAS1-like dehydratase domain-containing protein [Nocardia iowensis]|uniref:MaoC family dehydratase N-terminal domain-containing protein n=1 Tax=Nocardia iowensis TaxID=204891 RepID=A0ABX8RVT4_NOCIO|nr:MaoC family dehydratase N-terminal domain-containing protein [Nocardia iowensis]QXN92989.1 MaoC family dehydratase N-terminal domain-containing protein [Nocardia iowensis]
MSMPVAEFTALIGREVTYTAPEPLGRAAIRYFAVAVGDDNPLYTDETYARAHGYAGVIAPPTLICETNQFTGLPRDDDGFAGHNWGIEVPGTSLVRGGNTYEFHQPTRPADIITAAWRIVDVETKGGKLFVRSRATYRNQHGALLATNDETLIYVPLAAANPRQTPEAK